MNCVGEVELCLKYIMKKMYSWNVRIIKEKITAWIRFFKCDNSYVKAGGQSYFLFKITTPCLIFCHSVSAHNLFKRVEWKEWLVWSFYSVSTICRTQAFCTPSFFCNAFKVEIGRKNILIIYRRWVNTMALSEVRTFLFLYKMIKILSSACFHNSLTGLHCCRKYI